MENPFPASSAGRDDGESSLRPWLIYVIPFVVYMLLNSLEPARPDTAQRSAEPAAEGKAEPEGGWLGLGIAYKHYPLVYTAKIAITAGLLLSLARDYGRLPWRVTPLAAAIGAAGMVVWIAITELGLEPMLLKPIGLEKMVAGGRAAYNPLAELKDHPALANGFLAIRFMGLVVIVPIVEELFLRGFLMRYLTDQRWWAITLGAVSATAIIMTTGAAMAMHPAELFAELAWFSMVTWLMLRTQNLTDCIVAHGVTNLLLGIYVVTTGSWYYW